MKRTRLAGITLIAAMAAALISCGVDRGTAPTPEFSTAKGPKVAKCTPQHLYAFSGKTIGPAGGSLTVGKHKLEIPRGALTRSVFISMEMGSDTTNSVQFKPEGLVFVAGHSPQLTLDYGNCSVGLDSAKVAYTTNQLQIIQILPSVDDKKGKKVKAPLQHFSRYAVAY